MKLLLTSAGITNTSIRVDDETAIKVVDGWVEVVSGGRWRLFAR